MAINVKGWPRDEEGRIEDTIRLIDVIREARSYEDQVELLEGLTHPDDLAQYLWSLPIDPEDRLPRIDLLERALAGIDDQDHLRTIVRGFADPRIRRQAASRLTRQTDLEEVADNMDEDCETRLEAVTRITDQTWLEKTAHNMTTGCPRLPVAALMRLTAILAELASLAYLPRDKEGRIIDQAALLQAIRRSYSYPQQEAVLAELTHEADLTLYLLNLPESDDDLHLHSGGHNVVTRFVAMERRMKETVTRIDDQELLGLVALESKFHNVRRQALKRITLESVLKKVAENTENKAERFYELQLDAIDRITDQAWLGKMALSATTRYSPLPGAALARVTNPHVLAEIVRKDMRLTIEARAATAHEPHYSNNGGYSPFSDEDDLRHMAWRNHRDLALEAISRVHDQKLLAEVVGMAIADDWIPQKPEGQPDGAPEWAWWNWMEDGDSKLARAALRNLKHQKLLAKLIWTPNIDDKIIYPALDNLHDESLLTAIAIGFPNPNVAKRAVYSIQNPKKLTRISQQAQEASVREIAQKRLA